MQKEEEDEVLYSNNDILRLQNFANIMAGKKQKNISELYKKDDNANDKLKTKKSMNREEGIFEFHNKICIYDSRSFFLFYHKQCFRKAIVWFIEWKWFERAIITIIALNSLFLPFYDYEDRNNLTKKNQIIDTAGVVFTVLFTIEALLKMIAMGLVVHKNAYLRNGWNWIDFTVVIIGILDILPGIQTANLKALRTMRVIRPLKSINSIPSMRRLISSLLESLPALANAAAFLIFFFMLFDILGVQQFVGDYYQKCRLTPLPLFDQDVWPIDTSITRLCSQTTSGGGMFFCPAGLTCGEVSDYNISLKNENVSNDPLTNYGMMTFDHIGYGFLTLFQCITLENWTQVMYMMMDANSSVLSPIFFCLFSIIGGIFLLNVILAIIMGAFEDVDKKQAEQDDKKRLEITKALDKQKKRNQLAYIEHSQEINSNNEKIGELNQSPQSQKEDNKADYETNMIDQLELDLQEIPSKVTTRAMLTTNVNPDVLERGYKGSIIEKETNFEELQIKFPGELASEFNSGAENQRNLNNSGMRKTLEISASDSILIPDRAKRHKVFYVFYRISINSVFSSLIILLILANTIVLALDRYPIDKEDSYIQNILNQIFSWFFFAEMVVKLIGLGPKSYITDTFNIFDCTVVILSTIDIAIGWAGVSLTGGAISALRSLRILRIFKLARSWTSFRELLGKIIKSIKDIGNFSVLLGLFIFIYILLGMELYAYRIQFDDNSNPLPGGASPRENFDYFFMGLNTVFQVIIGDNWPNFMYNFIRCSNWGASIFFVMLYIFGNIILLNLFLAILLKNFEEPEQQVHQVEETKLSATKKLTTMLIKQTSCLKKIFCICHFCKGSVQNCEGADKGKGIEIVVFDESEKSDNKMLSQDQTRINQLYPHGSKARLQENVLGYKDGQFDISQEEDSSRFISKAVDSPRMDQDDARKMAIGVNFIGQQSQIMDKKLNYQTKNSEVNILDTQFNENHPILENQSDKRSSQNQNLINEDQLSIADSQYFKPIDPMSLTANQFNAQSKFKEQGRALGVSLQMDFKRSKTINQDGMGSPSKLSMSQRIGGLTDNQSLNSDRQSLQTRQKVSLAQKRKSEMQETKKSKQQELIDRLQGKSLYLFGAKNFIRIKCAQVIGHRFFENFILFVIIVSSILLAVDNPLDNPEGMKQLVLHQLDIILTTVFTCECVTKIIVFGFILNGPESYLKSGWNIMDFIIVTISIISLSMTGVHLAVFKALRLLRILRPLRMISRNQNLKIAVQSLLNSIPGVLNVMIISVLFMILFGILGVNFFKGRLFYCVTTNVDLQLQSLIWFKWDCINSGGEWVNQDNNFDNILNAFVALFNAMSQEGWSAIMYTGADVIDYNVNPQMYYSQFNMIFFMAYMIVCHLFILNLFVGVVINTFNKEQDRLGGGLLMTPTQKEWVQLQIMSYKTKPDMKFQTTGSKVRDFCIQLAQNQWFEKVIIGCIILNTIVLSLKWYDQSPELPNVTDKLNYLFTSIFALEAIIKLIAFKGAYFKQGWNIFDFIIVIGTFAGILVGQVSNVNVGPQTTVIRAFRIGRILRIIRKYKSLRKIFNTFVLAIPSLANVGGLLFLLLYLYAILGVYLFAGVQLQGSLDIHANFQSFGFALLTLIRCTTGESWNLIMFDCGRQFSLLFQCVQNQQYSDFIENGIQGCGNKYASLTYFLSFILVIAFIFLNMFVAIILEGFSSSGEDEDMRIQEDTLIIFKSIWINYDPNGKGFIDVYQFENLILDLVEYEIQQKRGLINENSKRLQEGMLLPGEHILFDLHKNQTLELCGMNRHGIDPMIKEKLGLSEFEIKRQLKRDMKNYIAQLHLPTYKSMKNYNFYDILEGLSKDLFDKDFKERRSKESYSVIEQLRDEIRENKSSTDMQKEIQEENLLTDFDEVIEKLETRADKEHILKYDQLKAIRKKLVVKNKAKLDTFNGNNLIDSAFVAHGAIIQAYVKNWVEKKRRLEKLRETMTKLENNFNFELEKLDSQPQQKENDPKEIKAKSDNSKDPVEAFNLTEENEINNLNEDESQMKVALEKLDQQEELEKEEASQSPVKQFQFPENEQFNKQTFGDEPETHFLKMKNSTKQSQKVHPLNINPSQANNDLQLKQDSSEPNNQLSQQHPNSGYIHSKPVMKPLQMNIAKKNISQLITDKILEASRPFSPSRIQTPALFSEETKSKILRFNYKVESAKPTFGSGMATIQEKKEFEYYGAPSTTNKDSSFKEDAANIGNDLHNKFSPVNSSYDYSPRSSISSNKDKYSSKYNFHQQNQLASLEGTIKSNQGALNQQSAKRFDKNFEFTSEELQDHVLEGQYGRNKGVPGLRDYDMQVSSPIQTRSVQTRGLLLNNLPLKYQQISQQRNLEGPVINQFMDEQESPIKSTTELMNQGGGSTVKKKEMGRKNSKNMKSTSSKKQQKKLKQ